MSNNTVFSPYNRIENEKHKSLKEGNSLKPIIYIIINMYSHSSTSILHLYATFSTTPCYTLPYRSISRIRYPITSTDTIGVP